MSAGRPATRARTPDSWRSMRSSRVAERQVIVGVHIEPPEQLLAPRRQRVRADRLDVDQRQQAQHLQALFDADQIGQLADDLRILSVAAERDERHLGDGESETRRPRRIPPAAPDARIISSAIRTLSSTWSSSRHLPTSWNSSDRTSSSGCAQIVEQRREALAALHGAASSGARRSESSVACARRPCSVVEVAHDPGEDGLEFGEHPSEQSAVVHFRQSCVQARRGRRNVTPSRRSGAPRPRARPGPTTAG